MEEKTNTTNPLGTPDPKISSEPNSASPDSLTKKPEEIKSSMDSSIPANPYKSLNDPLKFTSPFSAPEQSPMPDSVSKNPIDSSSKPDTSKDILTTLKTDSASNTEKPAGTGFRTNLETSANITMAQETDKKSGIGLFIIIAIILVIVASAASGAAVYYWQSSLISPVQKDKALLQSQVGNMKSQIDLLQKDKELLESEISRMAEEANRTMVPAPPADITAPVTTPPPTGEMPPVSTPADQQTPPVNPGQ